MMVERRKPASSNNNNREPKRITADQIREKRGINCPQCGNTNWFVYYTRYTPGKVIRARTCRHCKLTIRTIETAQ